MASFAARLRIGLGEDSHRLIEGGPLRLGGVDIPHDRRLDGHSDADALPHAVTDAVLGAAGLPDIGQLFPNTDPANQGRDSAEMLTLAYQEVVASGYRLVNLDSVIAMERPRFAPHKEAICQRIADIVGVARGQINCKAKTGEGVGAIGREEAISVRCVALLETADSGTTE
ncbi:MAG: 2-C-methyl-D-erythritol 2,4-cyclodiphosphate synthase [Planctomycetales bacterium]|nr:2-C-methyl-D-erythritol 2,4-cyclodiphosphate synthase [Planctomycetales bacterium]